MIAFFAVAGAIGVIASFMLCKSLRVPPSEVKDEPDPPAPPPKPEPPAKLPRARAIDSDRRATRAR